MPSFSQQSISNLTTCDDRLQRLFLRVIERFDCTVLEGYRAQDRQTELYSSGASKVKNGAHNVSPAMAVDVAPYVEGRGIPWPKPGSATYLKDIALFYYFAGWVMATAVAMNLSIRWGGDWDRDQTLTDQTFDDLVHFELMGYGSSQNV